MSSPTLTPAEEAAYFAQSRRGELYGAYFSTYALAILAIVLRFTARRIMKAGFWLDDWLVIVALALSAGLLTECIIWVEHGLGKHVTSAAAVLLFFQDLWRGELLAIIVLWAAKYSVLAFYWRLFTSARIHRWLKWLTVAVTCFHIATVLVIVFQCFPVSDFWNKPGGPTCTIPQYGFFLGISIPNIVMDVIVLMFPIPWVLKLQSTPSQKAALCGMFLLGGFVCIMSIIRLVTFVHVDFSSTDLTWNFVPVVVYTFAEANIAIVSACLPSLRPIYVILTGSRNRPSSKFRTGNRLTHTISTHALKGGASDDDSQHPFTALSENENALELRGKGGMQQAIKVTHEVEISWDVIGMDGDSDGIGSKGRAFA